MPLKPLLTNLIKLKKNKKQKVTAKKKEKVDTKIESQLKLIKFLIYGDIKVHVQDFNRKASSLEEKITFRQKEKSFKIF